MKTSLKKGLSLALASSMVLSLGACSTNSVTQSEADTKTAKTSGAETKTDGVKSNDSASGGEYTDYSKGFEEKVTIQIPIYDRAFEGWNPVDNYYTDWIQKEFGDTYNVDVEFVAISRSNEINDYMQMLASGKAPDIIFNYDMPQMLSYYDEGAMQTLDLDEIAYYAPSYWEGMGKTIDEYGKVDGDNYLFFANRPDAYNFVTLIRKDWLDQVKMEMPTTLEELNEVLRAWKAAGLGNGSGKLQQNAFIYDYPFRDLNMSDEEHALYSDLAVAAFTWEPTKKYLESLNMQYNEGIIDTEFYLNSDDTMMLADFASGVSGICDFYIANNAPIFDSLKANDPNAEVAYLPISALSPEGTKPQRREYWPYGMIMGINHSVTDEERAAIWMYLEWMNQEENLFYLQNGAQGENYNLDEVGLPVKVEDYSGEKILSDNNNKDYWCLLTETAQYADEEKQKEANIRNWAPKGHEQIIEDSYNDYTATAEYRKEDPTFTVILSSLAEYKAALNEKWKELYVKCVMAPADQFEEVYKAACEDYLTAGFQEILNEKQKAIDAGNYK